MSRSRAAGSAVLVLSVAVVACGGPAPPPEPGLVQGFAPDLRGRRVMVLPVQQNNGVPGDVDAEFAFALRERGAGVQWALPGQVEEVLARSPGLGARTRGLPVGQFTAAEVQRVGDPLYGELRRLASLVDADVILLPVQAALAGVAGGDLHVRFWTALVEARTGRVLWFSVLEGDALPRGDPRALASAVEEVTRALLWYGAN